jgi:hypothetical protein
MGNAAATFPWGREQVKNIDAEDFVTKGDDVNRKKEVY